MRDIEMTCSATHLVLVLIKAVSSPQCLSMTAPGLPLRHIRRRSVQHGGYGHQTLSMCYLLCVCLAKLILNKELKELKASNSRNITVCCIYLGGGPDMELCCAGGTCEVTCIEEVLESRESEGGNTVGLAVAHTIELVEL